MLRNREDRQRIRRWIERQGLTQEAAAKRLRCSSSLLSYWLAGQREISRRREAEWARITGIPLRVFRMPKAGKRAA